MRVISVAAAIVLGITFGALPASAQLARVGPTVPETGFPMWYQDTTGIALEFCQPLNAAELADGWCLLLPADTAVPETFPAVFSEEHFYWAADAAANFTANGVAGKALLTLALEAAFGQGPVVPGDQVVFGRIRVSIKAVPYTGTYTVTHPYGIEVFQLTAGERLFYTEDIGFGCATGFECAVNGRVGPFLLASSTPGGPELPGVPGPVPGKLYIANPARIGPVTGSPTGQNFFRVEGPNAFLAQTSDFTLMGRVYKGAIPGKLTIDRASYASGPNDVGGVTHKLDVFATAHPTTQARVPAGPPAQVVLPVLSFHAAPCAVTPTGQLAEPDVPGVQMYNQAADYYGQTTDLAAIPPAVCVEDYTARDINGQVVPLFSQANVTDQVTITEALYDPANGGTLSVKAFSSDRENAPTLSVGGQGAMVSGLKVTTPIAAPPARVQVMSSRGGQADLLVSTLAGLPGGGGVPLAGNDTPPAFGEDSPTVILDVLANDTVDGAPINRALATVNLVVTGRLGSGTVNANGDIEYTPLPNAWGSEGIGYTVTVGGKTSPAAYVSITINPMNDPPVAVDDAANGTSNVPAAINVLANDSDIDGEADLVSAVIVTPPVGATAVVGAGGVVTFTAAAAGTYTFTYAAVDLAGAQSANAATVTVSVAGAETIAIGRSEFVPSMLRWRVDGTDSVPANQTVTITYDNGTLIDGTPLVGTVIATAVVDALGIWTVDLRLTSATDLRNPNASNTFDARPSRIRATSSLGATATAAIAIK